MATHVHDHEHEHDDSPSSDKELEHDAAVEHERELRKQVALAQIRQYGDRALRLRSSDVEVFDDELGRVADRMIQLMHDAEGVGLAANQVGIVRRFFVFHDENEDHVLVNPVLVSAGDVMETDDEGCLSLGPVRVPVERPIAVEVEGKDVEGRSIRFELEGLAARCVQHELDHLDGTLTIDRTDDASRREALRQLRPRLQLR